MNWFDVACLWIGRIACLACVIPILVAIYWNIFEDVQRAYDTGHLFWEFVSQRFKERAAAREKAPR